MTYLFGWVLTVDFLSHKEIERFKFLGVWERDIWIECLDFCAFSKLVLRITNINRHLY